MFIPFKNVLKSVRRSALRASHIAQHYIGSPLIKFRLDYHSQNGEDGVIAEILRRLNINNGWLVEFGAWDGIYASNTYRLVENGTFKAVYIEGDAKRFNDLKNTAAKVDGRIIPLQAFVEEKGENSLDSLLAKTEIPKDFDILSVDIDSYDYQVWKSFTNYNPKIVIIEINASIPLGTFHVHGQPGYNVSSFESTLELGVQKGYTCVLHIGNMIFIRNDLVGRVTGKSLSIVEQKELFRYKK